MYIRRHSLFQRIRINEHGVILYLIQVISVEHVLPVFANTVAKSY